MKPKLIRTESEYQAALARIEKIFRAKRRSSDGDELELLVTLVELYEEKAFPIDLPFSTRSYQISNGTAGIEGQRL